MKQACFLNEDGSRVIILSFQSIKLIKFSLIMELLFLSFCFLDVIFLFLFRFKIEKWLIQDKVLSFFINGGSEITVKSVEKLIVRDVIPIDEIVFVGPH